MQKQNPTLLYIAVMNPLGLSELIQQVSGRPVGNTRDLSHFATIAERVGKQYGEKFYKGLAEIHPDKDFILDAFTDDEELNFSGLAVKSNGRKSKEYSNACGCQISNNADGSTKIMPCSDHAFRYATGNTPTAPTTKEASQPEGKPDNISILAIVAITVSIGLLAYGISKKS